ncbi:TetR/AcrR family transcriptional regulator (plasmid) [Roseomonas sp. OT10]|uniref:TetR/AcrR family transcriptional regulator n=1 Tax=Roseomonas cutis TaxID=2897332 RepID=UPI001E5FB11B|nr:TetR/AcrR family transcriptional regulator [Roseomonas sp. OT10]UFN51553.1 TetR/AcrR family transcriptional regulator [Roseomonas sp. OT10]
MLRAARELIEAGRQPGLAEIADHAQISRATAYRYFPTPEALIQEAILDAIAADLDRFSAAPPPGSPAEVLDMAQDLVAAVLALMHRHERLFRAYLAQAVLQDADVENRRSARRLDWLSQVLAPLRPHVSEPDFARLIHALALFTGIETVVVLRDVCVLSPAEIEDTARWVTRALIGAVQMA